MSGLPLDDERVLQKFANSISILSETTEGKKRMSFWKGTFKVEEASDTFLHFPGWGKGIVIINGFNLGRYWPDAGPQDSLYLPGPLLRGGADNTLLLLEQDNAKCLTKKGDFSKCNVVSMDRPKLDGPTPQ